ncbi:hypothetical protein ACLUEY_09925 [Vreelandella aquamarina]
MQAKATSYTPLPTPYDLLAMAWDEVVACAREVGIDAQALRYSLPASGQRLSGLNVPVLAPRYRHACSLIVYINPLPGGDAWPFIRFFTYKDGGRHCDFNGLRWWRNLGQYHAAPAAMPVFGEAQALAEERAQNAAQERFERFQRWANRWQAANPLSCDHRWLKLRLLGMAVPGLLARVTLREQAGFSGNTLMAPLEKAGMPIAGYQLIFYPGREREQEQKRLMIPEEGASCGAFIRLKAKPEGRHLPVALCEGLATGLTLALVWPGEIRVALNAHNLKAVREGVHAPVVVFHDDDRWKPEVGNTGYRAARAATRPGDALYGPVFSAGALDARPTDFNDLLFLDGMDALSEQLSNIQRNLDTA